MISPRTKCGLHAPEHYLQSKGRNNKKTEKILMHHLTPKKMFAVRRDERFRWGRLLYMGIALSIVLLYHLLVEVAAGTPRS